MTCVMHPPSGQEAEIGSIRPCDLSGEANFALSYLFAVEDGPGSPADVAFRDGVKLVFGCPWRELQQCESRWRALFAKGVDELAAKGVVDVSRSATGSWAVTAIHLWKLAANPIYLA